MKRILVSGLVVLLLLSMAGCGKKEEKKSAVASDVVASEEQEKTEPTIVPNQSGSESESAKTPEKQPEKTPIQTPEESNPVEQPKEPINRPVEPEEEVDPEELEEQRKEQYRSQLAEKLVGKWTRTHTVYLFHSGYDGKVDSKLSLPMTAEFADGMVLIRFDTASVSEELLYKRYLAYNLERTQDQSRAESNAKWSAENEMKYLKQEIFCEYELYDTKTLLVDGVDAGTISFGGDKLNWIFSEPYYQSNGEDLKGMVFTRVQ